VSFLFHLGLELNVPLEPKPRISPWAFNARYRCGHGLRAACDLFRYPLPCATSLMRRPSGSSSPVPSPSLILADLETPATLTGGCNAEIVYAPAGRDRHRICVLNDCGRFCLIKPWP